MSFKKETEKIVLLQVKGLIHIIVKTKSKTKKNKKKSFIMTFRINISVFFSYTINHILLNILKFLKGKFSHMTW